MFDVEESHWWFTSRRQFLTVILRSLAFSPRVIVDIGAGTGGMMKFLRQYGKTVIGIEPSGVGRVLAKKRGIVLRPGDAEHTKLSANSVDMVCFFDVLYHQGIHDTYALAEAKRILRPGGLLIITDCAMPFLEGPHDRAVAGRERYTLPMLTKKIHRAGFHVDRQTYMFFFLFPVVCMKRLIDRCKVWKADMRSDVRPASQWTSSIATVLNSVEAAGLRWFSYPWGSSLCIVARKRKAGFV